MRTASLPTGETVPALGLGTWRMGERGGDRREELAALRLGLDLGMTLVDTAEMYGDGRSEELVGEAIAGRRDEVFLVTKFYPHNASRAGVPAACARSLKRLGTDRIDLYLLHWPGAVPLAETVTALERLKSAGHIRHWGVSNFDTDDMDELSAVPGGEGCATDQVLYNLGRRGIEFDLLPWAGRRSMPVMAYTPLEPDRLAAKPALQKIADARGVAPLQVALAWVLGRPQVIAIPKASRTAHVRQNRAAHDLELTEDERAALDQAFPPPTRKRALEML
ncbi:diketogulonate reductase-like aldo/keto reductase [Stella humosa]|uniref:Diketogulonate reductase-like aldo/keto reductase n=1 Tax=Stella humosa TaxID=94 RepID=A0A3N1KUY5_9PROT|nr:aldo/keto reductase [Stella humosa]ROP83292.1 diketogulonate reductase-like aldo/keto reductase [Stella humosa]BBK29925.1 aldo/keto reductase [Stella humosa]